jgi:hypothetical protein
VVKNQEKQKGSCEEEDKKVDLLIIKTRKDALLVLRQGLHLLNRLHLKPHLCIKIRREVVKLEKHYR